MMEEVREIRILRKWKEGRDSHPVEPESGPLPLVQGLTPSEFPGGLVCTSHFTESDQLSHQRAHVGGNNMQ
jgi:hypothetical protein